MVRATLYILSIYALPKNVSSGLIEAMFLQVILPESHRMHALACDRCQGYFKQGQHALLKV